MPAEKQHHELPKSNRALIGGFRVFNRRFLQKHFHTIAVNRRNLQQSGISAEDSLVVYANHASWWDPLVALYMSDSLFPRTRMFAPIDAVAFEKYRIFGSMGFFPIEQHSLRGAAQFLKTSQNILSHPQTSIWITPEGQFADVRDTSHALMPGMSHLAKQLAQIRGPVKGSHHRVWFLPAAVEYVFWEERLPEILIWFGLPCCPMSPVHSDAADSDFKADWQRRLTDNLRQAQSELARHSIARDSTPFEILLKSRSGTFFVYDWWRRLKNRLQGQDFNVDHSQLLNQSEETATKSDTSR